MAQKRKAQDAFGKPNGQLSAVAAAKLAKQKAQQPAPISQDQPEESPLVATIAGAPYDGHHSGASSPEVVPNVEESVQPPVPPRPSVQLSTGNPKTIKESKNYLQLSLRADESVTVVGEYDLEVSKGVVSVYGAMIHSTSGKQRVYALSTQALPAIVARKDDTAIKLTSINSDQSYQLRSLEDLSPLFRNIAAKDTRRGRSFALLSKSADDELQRSLVPLEVDEDTKKILSRLNAKLESSSPRIMAVGAKSSGKSTFNRLLCNMIITRPGKQRCFYLDIDPGQPEFGPHGQLSMVEVTAPILGPSYTHPAASSSKAFRLIRSHTIAATSFKDDPGHYVSCVVDLAKRVPSDVPVVVNSCGWVAGLGATVLLDILAPIGVTDVVALGQLDSDLDADLRVLTSLHQIPRRQGRVVARTPADLRAMQTMAYFHQKDRLSDSSLRWIDKPISKIRPWIVSYSGEEAGITAILSYGQAPHPDFLCEVLEGSLVAIVVPDPGLIHDSAIDRTANEGLPYIISQADGFSYPIDPHQSHCVGLALIRGIDVQNKRFQLVAPLPENQIAVMMKQQVVLVRGNFDSPEWAYLEDLYAGDDDETPFDEDDDRPWVNLREPVGIEGSVWRLRHPPMRDAVR